MVSVETIFACSSGHGRAGISVWRISGPAARSVGSAIVGSLPKPRMASHRRFRDSKGAIVDDGLVIFFAGPQSATGEDIVEFHTHGSIAVRAKMIEIFIQNGLTPAKPGEFTLRAFENGQMDLLAVEALGDLLEAETELQRKQAVDIGSGAARQVIENWREGFLDALAVLSAAVDFPDEEDIPEAISQRAIPILADICSEMEIQHLNRSSTVIRDGLLLGIVGAPNVGKSSFLNRLLGEDRAIVSNIAGTTRDVVSERFVIADRLVKIVDTAGIRAETLDPIELVGIRRAREIVNRSDILILIRDASNPSEEDFDFGSAKKTIIIDNKMDREEAVGRGGLPLSLVTSAGWSDVVAKISEAVVGAAQPSLFPHERQRILIESAHRRLVGILDRTEGELPPELLAEDVRACLEALDQLEGRRTTEAVLGRIFSSFCIGK